MIWLWIILFVIGYITIGVIIAGLEARYIDHFDDSTRGFLITLYPIIVPIGLVIGFIYLIFIGLYELFHLIKGN